MKRLSFLFAALFCLFSAFSPQKVEPTAEICLHLEDETALSSKEVIGNKEGLQGTSPSVNYASHLSSQQNVQRGGRRLGRTLHGKLLPTTLSKSHKDFFGSILLLHTFTHPISQRPKYYYVFALRHILI